MSLSMNVFLITVQNTRKHLAFYEDINRLILFLDHIYFYACLVSLEYL